jgi:hypothetical protein
MTKHTKPSNPKDRLGILKLAMSCLSWPVLGEMALGMFEGARKYGKHNYRVIGVRGSVYFDAAMRHMMAWQEGEDIDPASGLHHITKALTSLMVMRDAMIYKKFVDDRPPAMPDGWQNAMNAHIKKLIVKYPNAVEPYTELKKGDDRIKE